MTPITLFSVTSTHTNFQSTLVGVNDVVGFLDFSIKLGNVFVSAYRIFFPRFIKYSALPILSNQGNKVGRYY